MKESTLKMEKFANLRNLLIDERREIDSVEVIRSLNRLKELKFEIKIKEQELENDDGRYVSLIKIASVSVAVAFIVGVLVIIWGYIGVGGGVTAVAVTLGIYVYLNRTHHPSPLTRKIEFLRKEAFQEAGRWGLELESDNMSGEELDQLIEEMELLTADRLL